MPDSPFPYVDSDRAVATEHGRCLSSGEEWRPVVGYEGLYEVSSLGRVRSLVTGKMRAPRVDRYGYLALTIWKDGRSACARVHRLVCLAFHGEPGPDQQAAHLDGNRQNPRADNLTWATAKENNQHKRAHGTYREPPRPILNHAGVRNPNAKLDAAAVAAIRAGAAAGVSGCELARRFGVSSSHANRIINNQQWSQQ